MSLGLYEMSDMYRKDKVNFQIQQWGNENPDKLICYINAGADISGLCAVLRRTLSGLYISDMFHAIPVVSWHEAPLLNDNKTINGSDNPFEYFFEAMSDIAVEEAQKSMNVIEHCNINDHYVWGEGKLSTSDGQPQHYITMLQEILKKYPLQLKKCVNDQIQNEIVGILGDEAVVGVHARGAQRKRRVKGLGNPIPLDWYLDELDKIFEEGWYNKIFLATDDDEYLRAFQKKYGNKVIYYTDVQRYNEGVVPYLASDNSKYRIVYEMLRDMYTLMNCGILIGGPSNVTLLIRVLKMYYGEWERCIMLDNGGECTDGEPDRENILKIIQNNGQADHLWNV